MNETSLRGLGVSPGLAIGTVYLVDRRRVKIPRYHVADHVREAEVARFERATATATKNLVELRARAKEGGLSQVSLLIEAHEMILQDDALVEATRALESELRGKTRSGRSRTRCAI